MTITGNGVNAQAITCEKYLHTTWPDIAKQLLDLLDKVLAHCDNGKFYFIKRLRDYTC
jgi:hypothetical protein